MKPHVWKGMRSGRGYCTCHVFHVFDSFEAAWAWIDIQRHQEPSLSRSRGQQPQGEGL